MNNLLKLIIKRYHKLQKAFSKWILRKMKIYPWFSIHKMILLIKMERKNPELEESPTIKMVMKKPSIMILLLTWLKTTMTLKNGKETLNIHMLNITMISLKKSRNIFSTLIGQRQAPSQWKWKIKWKEQPNMPINL